MKNISNLRINQCLLLIFNWAYDNDKRLYYNLDLNHSAFGVRNSVRSENDKAVDGEPTLDEIAKQEDFNIKSLFEQAIKDADYHDTYKFYWSLGYGGNSHVMPHVKYDTLIPHDYSDMIPLVKARIKELEELGLAEWRKSANHVKWSWYRTRLGTLNKNGYGNGIEIVVCQSGDSKLSTCFSIEAKDQILNYILENNIVPDFHYKEVVWTDPLDAGYDNPRKVSKLLGEFLVYLKPREMMEVKKKCIIQSYDKPEWAYITATEKHRDDIKFYIKLRHN